MHNEPGRSVETLLLSHFPEGTQVIARQGDLPYPMRVHLRTPSGSFQRCVVKINGHDAIERECQALRILSQLSLPVPEVLFAPAPLPSAGNSMVVLSELPGQSLPWCGTTSLAEADLTCRLVLEGVARLHQLTDQVLACDTAMTLPRHTLFEEHAAIVATAGKWMTVDLFRRAVERVGDALAGVDSPLVFSNGDYNPLNFLADGEALCGFVDFEHACFENPHIGFAKFLIWSTDEFGWGTAKKIGLVERYLYALNVSRCEFAPILAMRCMSHLIREVSVDDDKDARSRGHMLRIIEDGLQTIRASEQIMHQPTDGRGYWGGC